MESETQSRWLSYPFLLILFFAVLFVLDKFFGLHFEPRERQPLKKPKIETAAPQSQNSNKVKEIEYDSLENAPDTSSINNSLSDLNADAYYEALKKKYLSETVSGLPPGKARMDVIIRYYHHGPDGNSAYALQKLRYYIHERPVDPAFQGFQSNAIFYGDSVKVEDIQLVAFTLLQEGLPIKLIKPSQFHDNWKYNSIEIGTDTTLLPLPTLSKEDIKNFTR